MEGDNQQSVSFAILTPTIGRSTLSRAIESVEAQSYKNYTHYVLIDRNQELVRYGDSDNRIIMSFGSFGYFGNKQRFLAYPFLEEDYILYLDDDCFWQGQLLQELADYIKYDPINWGVFTQLRRGRIFLNTPAPCETDLNQIIHKRIINGYEVMFPDTTSSVPDIILMDKLKQISDFAIIETTSCVVYENLNSGKFF